MVESERRVLACGSDRSEAKDGQMDRLLRDGHHARLPLPPILCEPHTLLSMCPWTILLPKLPRRRRREIGFLSQAFCLTSCCVVAGWKFTYRVVGGLAEEDGGAEGADAPA